MLVLFLIILFSNFSLGLAVYLRNPRGKINKVFFDFVLAVTVWLLSNYLQNEPIGLPLASLFLRIDFAVAPLAAYFLLLFCLNFHRVHLLSSRLRELLALSPALALAILSFSDLIVTRIKFLNNTINFDLGGLYPLYTIYLFICVGIGCIDLIVKWRSSQGIERMQIFYLLLGFLLTACIVLPVNLFSQSVLTIKLFRIANYSFFFPVTFTTYSILKYRLMDVRVVIRETTIYLICSLVVLLFGLLLWFPLTRYFFLPPLVSLSLILIASAAVFRWIQIPMRKVANLYFFSSLRQTEEMVRFLSKKLTTLIDQSELVSVFLQTVIDSFKLDKAGIILRKGTPDYYESEKLIGFRAKKLSLKTSGLLIRHLKKIKSAEIKGELTLKIKDSSRKEETAQLMQLKEEMSKVEAEVCLALLSKGDLGGILILGKKISGRSYSKQDLELLQTLANQAAIALDNARLYQEVKKSLLERINLHEILLAISSLVHTDKILNLIVKSAIKFTDSQKSIILIMDEKKKEFYQAAVEPSNSNLLSPAENIQLYDIARRTAKEKKLLFSKLLVSRPGEELSDGKKEEVQTVLSLPLAGQKDILGILITCCSPLHSYNQEQVQILSILADQAVIAIEKAHLIDDLKGAQVDLENWGKELGRKVKKKSEELKKSQVQLLQSEKLAGIGQLAAGIAHEIRNPLGIIATSLYYLNDVLPKKKEDIKRHFQIMEAEISRCESIISNLLEFSRKSTQEVELIDVNQLLNVTLSLVEKDLFVKDIKLIKKFRHSPTIKANMDEMKQVFLNLILNASQAMPRGGRLDIATSISKNERVRIQIADSGTGIPEKHLYKIFDPFFTTKAPGEGTGLGLTLVHTVVERWEGTIQVKSQGVKGTTFTIEFPILKEEPSQEKINGPTS